MNQHRYTDLGDCRVYWIFGFLRKRCNKWYQSIPSSARDHVSIPRTSWSVQQRSYVDLRAAMVCSWDRMSILEHRWFC